jgi:hypothetical protein
MKPTDRFITAPLDEGLIVARRDGDRLFVMNGSARFMWERCAEGIADSEIPRLTAMHYGIDVEQARHDFGKALLRWQAEGLVEPPGSCRHYAIGDIPFSVRCCDAETEAAVAPLFSHLQRPHSAGNGRAPAEFDLSIEQNEFVLRADGIEVLRSADIDAIIDKLTLAVVMHAYKANEWLVSIHAAAVGTRDRCVLIPGESGSGKSTLTAALLSSQRLLYLTDDISLLDPGSFHIRPVPGALVLKSGSWQALEAFLPRLNDLPVRRRGGQDVRYWAPPATQVAPGSLPAHAIVFARYDAAGSGKLTRLSPLDGLSRLITAPCTVSAPITTETIHCVIGWARAIPFYTLVYGSLDEARSIVEDLLGS